MARRAVAVHRDVLEIQGFEQRYLAGVGAREGGFQFCGNALLEPLRGGGAELLQEGSDQPAADSPGHAEIAVEFDRPLAQTPIDIDLLMRRGAVPAVLRGLSQEGGL